MQRYKLWTGPCDVNRCADLLEKAGARNVLRGTEHVYYDVQHSPGWDGFCVASKALGDHHKPLYWIGADKA